MTDFRSCIEKSPVTEFVDQNFSDIFVPQLVWLEGKNSNFEPTSPFPEEAKVTVLKSHLGKKKVSNVEKHQ